LAKERNDLVHVGLASFHFESETECKNFIDVLDEQNQRILNELSFLSPAIRALSALSELANQPEALEELLNASTSFTSADATK
jgi:hypothetical protein